MNVKEPAVRGRSGPDEDSDAGEKLADFRSISRPYKRKEDREIQDVVRSGQFQMQTENYLYPIFKLNFEN